MDNLIKIVSCETFWNDKHMKKHPSCRDSAHIKYFKNLPKQKRKRLTLLNYQQTKENIGGILNLTMKI